MCVEEKNVFLDAIEAEERLGVTVGDEAENCPSVGVGAADICDDANRGCTISTPCNR